MLTQTPPRTFTRTITAPPAEVYRMFNAPVTLREWMCDAAEVDLRLGGHVYLWWNQGYYTAGTFTEVVRNERLALTWQGSGEPPSAVQITFSGTDEQTTITVVHTSDEDLSDSQQTVIDQGWESSLENLQSVLETGVDLRLARRPMFGLNSANVVTESEAAELGVPVTEGLIILGLVDGLAAHNAGIQKNDVVVRLGDYPVTDFPSFGTAIGHYKAGDHIEVEIYRGPSRQVIPLELSRRPAPEIPADLAALTELTRAANEARTAELTAGLAGISEAAADHRRKSDGWNAKEVMAHLIVLEEEVESWIVGLIEEPNTAPLFHNNITPRMRAVAQSYSTLAGMAEAFQRGLAINLALIENLPPAVAARKTVLRDLGTWMKGIIDHDREHIAEIQALAQEAS